MYEVLKPLYPSGPCNRTDPIVRHDPSIERSPIVKTYSPQSDEEFPNSHSGIRFDATMVDGIHVPLLKVNNNVIDMQAISYFKLNYNGLLPSVDVIIVDMDGMIEFSDVPGFNNVITVVMICPVDGIYKKVSLDFYITSCNFCGGMITYHGEYKLLPLEATQFKQIKFHHPLNGCPAKWCQLPPDDKPTTYELLHCIAHECGLGFAATQQCKEIGDHNYRLLSSQKYKDTIAKHIAFGGTDENSIFDAWVDLFGYLVMVNIPWIMNENVMPDELAITAATALEATDTSLKNQTDKSEGLVHRILTNYTSVAPNNLTIINWTPIVDTSTNWYNGTLTTYNLVKPIGNGGQNGIDTSQIQQQENSIDGEDTTKYEFHRTLFLGHEMSPNTAILNQKEIRTKYLQRLRSRRLKVELGIPNYGLERGMLVEVMIYEFDQVKKRKILANMTNLAGDKTDVEDPDAQKYMEEQINGTAMANLSISGTYYIDGEEFVYDGGGSQKITQFLYLIKKGGQNNWDSSVTPQKVKLVNPNEKISI